jgi:hypothetical protein
MLRLFCCAKKGLADRVGEDVIEVEMQLAHDTDIVAARPIDRDDGFDGQLVFVAHVDDTAIDRAGRSLLAVEDGDLRGEVPFDLR